MRLEALYLRRDEQLSRRSADSKQPGTHADGHDAISRCSRHLFSDAIIHQPAGGRCCGPLILSTPRHGVPRGRADKMARRKQMIFAPRVDYCVMLNSGDGMAFIVSTDEARTFGASWPRDTYGIFSHMKSSGPLFYFFEEVYSTSFQPAPRRKIERKMPMSASAISACALADFRAANISLMILLMPAFAGELASATRSHQDARWALSPHMLCVGQRVGHSPHHSSLIRRFSPHIMPRWPPPRHRTPTRFRPPSQHLFVVCIS